MSKCINLCLDGSTKSIKKKYCKRPGPPYSASQCEQESKLGNDLHTYYRKKESSGFYKWVKSSSSQRKKSVKKRSLEKKKSLRKKITSVIKSSLSPKSQTENKRGMKKETSVKKKILSLNKKIAREQLILKEKIENQQRLLNKMNEHKQELEKKDKELSRSKWEKDILSQVNLFKNDYSKPYMWTSRVLKIYGDIDYLTIMGVKKVNDNEFHYCYYEPPNRSDPLWRVGIVDYNVTYRESWLQRDNIPTQGQEKDDFNKNLNLFYKSQESFVDTNIIETTLVGKLLKDFPTDNSKAITFSHDLEKIRNTFSTLQKQFKNAPNNEFQSLKSLEFNGQILKKIIENYQNLISCSQQYKKWWIERDSEKIEELNNFFDRELSKYLSKSSQEDLPENKTRIEGNPNNTMSPEETNQILDLGERLSEILSDELYYVDFDERIGSVLAEASGFVGPPLDLDIIID